MERTATALVALMLVAASFGVVPATALQSSSDAASTSTGATTVQTNNTSIAPGARLSGAVGVQESEIDGEVESRAFGLRVAEANTDDAKARTVAQQFNESERRTDEIETRLQELKEARENGSISEGQYAARAAQLHAELNNVQRMANETASVAERLPDETLAANGVNVTAIETLHQRAATMSGPEIAAIAQTIAGPEAGQAPDRTGDRERGPGAGNRTADRPGTQTDSDDRPGGEGTGNETADDAETATDEDETTTAGSGDAPQSGERSG